MRKSFIDQIKLNKYYLYPDKQVSVNTIDDIMLVPGVFRTYSSGTDITKTALVLYVVIEKDNDELWNAVYKIIEED